MNDELEIELRKRLIDLENKILEIIAEWANEEALSFDSTTRLGNKLDHLFKGN